MKREVIIVGGGVAGIQTALRLADRGIRPTIVEKEPDLGGKLRGWYHLFPSLTPASEVLSELRRRLAARDVEVMTSAEAVSITPGSVTLADGRTLECGSVVVCSGFTLFDARLKEEYGYGVYDNVFTSRHRADAQRRECDYLQRSPSASDRPAALRGIARREGVPGALFACLLHHGCQTGHGTQAAVSGCRRL